MEKIESNFTLNVEYDADAKVYVSHCPELSLYAYGDSEEEALSYLNTTIPLCIKYLKRRLTG